MFDLLLAVVLILSPQIAPSKGAIRISPQIVSFPPAITYMEQPRSVLQRTRLTCKVWPPNADVRILASSHPTAGTLSLHALPKDHLPHHIIIFPPIGQLTRPEHELPAAQSLIAAQMEINESTDVWRLSSVDLFCLASTPFAALVSPAFRVTHARLGSFQAARRYLPLRHEPSLSPYVSTVEFIQGNIAFISCQLPEDSQPTPIIQFYLNDSLIGDSERYRQVARPNENRVVLLISPSKSIDEGRYQCAATNQVTQAKEYSPEMVYMKIRVPQKPVPVKILLPLFPPQTHRNQSEGRKIFVREGDNVTLFCVMEGAPPPETRTYPFERKIDRYTYDHNFGLLHIVNVRPDDSLDFLCTGNRVSSTVQLVVKRRLRLVDVPQDVRILKFGDSAQFICTTSDIHIMPIWLFNGKPKLPLTLGAKLLIASVTQHDLGIYQCVARTLTTEGRIDEWVSASATLSLTSDIIIRNYDDLLKISPPQHRNEKQEVITEEMTPSVEVIFDNLAVYITWSLSEDSLRHAIISAHPELLAGPSYPSSNWMWDPSKHGAVFRIQYAFQTGQPLQEPALVGLVEPEAPNWSHTKELDKQVSTQYLFLSGPPLQAGRKYRFRVRAVDPNTGLDLIPHSGWSQTVSTQHISTVKPPKILDIQQFAADAIRVIWKFTSDVKETKSGRDSGGTAEGVKAEEKEVFIPDYFLILARPVLRQRTSQSGGLEYGHYHAVQVNGSNIQEAVVRNLSPSLAYQVVVYGVRSSGTGRMITLFSDPVFTTKATRFSFKEAFMNNKLIFIGLGFLAGLMLLVALTMTIICTLRQHKDKLHRNAKQNGFLYSYEDSLKCAKQTSREVAVSEGHRPRSHDLSPPGDAMMMRTLLKRGFDGAEQRSSERLSPTDSGAQRHFQEGASFPLQSQHHHFSHQSLQASMVSPGAMPQVMYQGEPARYLRDASLLRHAANPAYLDSQLLLNRSMHSVNADQNSLMQDFYQKQAYQQSLIHPGSINPLMYPSNVYLPPVYPNGSMAYCQGHQLYYGTNLQKNHSLKREPPSGGSMHEACGMDGVSLKQMHFSQQQQPGFYPISPLQQQHFAMDPSGIQMDPSFLRHHNINQHGDGESIYSYFSQQDMCSPTMHAHLNTLPEEGHLSPGFTESGSQTVGPNATSPNPVVEQRHHHRRKRRRHQQILQTSADGENSEDLPRPQIDDEDINGEVMVNQRANFNGSFEMTPNFQDDPLSEQIRHQEGHTMGPVGLRGSMPPPSLPPPPPPAAQIGLPPRIRDYSEYGIPAAGFASPSSLHQTGSRAHFREGQA